MFPNERYVSGHFRSYLISCFNYTRSGDLVAVRGFKVVTLIQPAHYDYAAAVLFLASGVWPTVHRFRRNIRGSREGSLLIALSNHFTSNFEFFGYGFM